MFKYVDIGEEINMAEYLGNDYDDEDEEEDGDGPKQKNRKQSEDEDEEEDDEDEEDMIDENGEGDQGDVDEELEAVEELDVLDESIFPYQQDNDDGSRRLEFMMDKAHRSNIKWSNFKNWKSETEEVTPDTQEDTVDPEEDPEFQIFRNIFGGRKSL